MKKRGESMSSTELCLAMKVDRVRRLLLPKELTFTIETLRTCMEYHLKQEWRIWERKKNERKKPSALQSNNVQHGRGSNNSSSRGTIPSVHLQMLVDLTTSWLTSSQAHPSSWVSMDRKSDTGRSADRAHDWETPTTMEEFSMRNSSWATSSGPLV